MFPEAETGTLAGRAPRADSVSGLIPVTPILTVPPVATAAELSICTCRARHPPRWRSRNVKPYYLTPAGMTLAGGPNH